MILLYCYNSCFTNAAAHVLCFRKRRRLQLTPLYFAAKSRKLYQDACRLCFCLASFIVRANSIELVKYLCCYLLTFLSCSCTSLMRTQVIVYTEMIFEQVKTVQNWVSMAVCVECVAGFISLHEMAGPCSRSPRTVGWVEYVWRMRNTMFCDCKIQLILFVRELRWLSATIPIKILRLWQIVKKPSRISDSFCCGNSRIAM